MVFLISSDGKLFLKRNNDSDIIQIWDFEKDLRIQELKVPDERMIDCEFSSDNKYLACLSCFWICIWDLELKKMLWTLKSISFRKENNWCVRFTPDNKHIVCAGDDLTLRDLKTGEIVWRKKNLGGTSCSLKVSYDGKYILTTNNLWDLSSGRLIREFILDEDIDEDYFEVEFGQVAISPNNKYIAITFGLGATIVWSFEGNIIYRLRKVTLNTNYADSYLFTEFSLDGKNLASLRFDRRSIDIWDITDGTLVNTIEHKTEITYMKFIRKINYLALIVNEQMILVKYLQDDKSTLSKIENIKKLISEGESQRLEFKSSLRWDYRTKCVNKDLEHVIAKSISGFLNSEGGTLLIGVADKQEIIGLQKDYNSLRKKNRDGFQLQLVQVISNYIGIEYSDFWNFDFINIDGKDICIINVKKSPEAVYTKKINKNGEDFFIRKGSSTRSLTFRETETYKSHHFKDER